MDTDTEGREGYIEASMLMNVLDIAVCDFFKIFCFNLTRGDSIDRWR